MELVPAFGSSQILFAPMHNYSWWQNWISETICDRSVKSVYGRQQRVDRRAGYFKDQWGWPLPNLVTLTLTTVKPLLSLDLEVESSIRLLRPRNSATSFRSG